MNIHFLDVLTIVCTGLMIGIELAISLFVNPAIWKNDDRAQAKIMAQTLGKVMPFWYACGLILLGTEAYLRRHSQGAFLLALAAVSWTAIIVYTIVALVPVNNRVAASADSTPAQWRQDHKTWDTRHRWRILFLTASLVCFLFGILPGQTI